MIIFIKSKPINWEISRGLPACAVGTCNSLSVHELEYVRYSGLLEKLRLSLPYEPNVPVEFRSTFYMVNPKIL